MTLRFLLIATLLAFAGPFVSPLHASDFDIDTTFGVSSGTPGWRRTYVGFGSVNERIVAAARAPDGGYVLAGSRPGGAAGVSIFLAKFRPNGGYDPAFGNTVATGSAGQGRVLKDAYLSSVTDMTIDLQGRIIVVGSTPGALGQPDFGVVRFKTDGTVDTSFAGDGGTGIPFDADPANNRVRDTPTSVTTAADGSIFVAGEVQENIGGVSTIVVGIAKLKVDGSLDTNFSDLSGIPAGRRELCRNTCGAINSVARVIFDDSRQRLTVGGDYSYAENDTDWFLVTLNVVTQSIVTSKHVIDFGGTSSVQLGLMTNLSSDTQGNIVAIGAANDASVVFHPVVLRRLSGVATEDGSFGNTAGRGIYFGATIEAAFYDLAFDSLNRIILAGSGSYPYKGAVFRLKPNGVSDNSFSGGIVPLYDAPTSSPSSTAFTTVFKRMFLDANQPVIAGEAPYSSSAETDYDLVVTRLKSDLIFASSFD